MAQSDDPVESGFVASLARPGGNVTGLTTVSPQLSGKRLALLKEAVPKVTRVAVLWNVANPVAALQLRETQVAARTLGLKLQSLEVRAPKDLDRAFAAMRKERVGALVVLPDLMFFDHQKRLADLVAKSRLPAIYEEREFAEAGGLMAYGPNYKDLFRRAATYVDKILKGTKPGDLPVEQPTKFELVINLKTAKALGLTIPPSVLLRADQVIQ
jgi:putative ABC transport system substrate-binding protein